MRWITEQACLEAMLRKGLALEVADASGQVESMELLHFESMELVTRPFFRLLKSLLRRGGDHLADLLTLDPDPATTMRTFGRYQLIEVTIEDSEYDYIKTLNAEVEENPASAISTNWWKYVLIPKSSTWFVVGTRDFSNNTNGHIWCPTDWAEWVKSEYPGAI